MNGASSPKRLVEAAATDGQPALALTDRHSLAGVVQFIQACKIKQIKPIVGAELVVAGYPIVLLCADREGYANLCDLLTLTHSERLQEGLSLEQLEERFWDGGTEGLFCLTGDTSGYLARAVHQGQYRQAREYLMRLAMLFPKRLFIELVHHRVRGNTATIKVLMELSCSQGVPVVATNAICYARPEEYALFDALTCARLGLTVGDAHQERPINNQAYLRSMQEMLELGFPATALANTQAIARLCQVDLLAERVTPPVAQVPDGMTPSEYLQGLCFEALSRRFTASYHHARSTLQRELSVIRDLGLDEFFLVVREVVQYARACGIRCSGRGSAANSLVAYLLNITGVDPLAHHLLFERFLHAGRKGMPDIDIDFATHRRGEVIEWMGRRFGESHTAMTANVITFRLRLAVREMMKILGYPLLLINQCTKLLPHAAAHKVREHRESLVATLGESVLLKSLLSLVESLHGCPRHLSLHAGGMILSRTPLRFISPIQTSKNGVRQIQFNKDDVEALGLIKFDVLGLRTLSVVTETLELLQSQGVAPPDVDALPLDDERAFELIRSGQTMAVFQLESPGQWHLLSCSQPKTFNDLVAQVALFRPGPLQGHMVAPYVLRRRQLRQVEYPHPSLEKLLKDTYG
ncbi:MAG: DNA polymerase III subunit alpha, partial [Abitibacteriaceae bacterium]|nr:DNA polymerase III subunit alpha [Abditibacteriaceae bacterium]